jgi:hypothetical protein
VLGALGSCLSRVPDGETGERRRWIYWQRTMLDFLHLPVPQDRDDPAYVALLAGLAVPERTRLYLGLLHYGDEAGDHRRIDTARAVVPSFGVATECGWGRGDPGRVAGLLESHRRAVAYLTNSLPGRRDSC